MRFLYIGGKQEKVVHGWDQVNKRNQKVLESIADTVAYMPLDKSFISSHLFFGISNSFLKKVEKELQNNYDYVFVCQSNCGRICKYIKKIKPNQQIITFFHNVEIHYAKEYMKVAGLRASFFYLRVKLYEGMACKYSDVLITLNDRDSRLLESTYGRKAIASLPTSLEDKYTEKETDTSQEITDCIDYLFVGAAFYANIEGVQWFIDNVMHSVSGDLYIVGLNMSEDKFKNLNERIHVYGFVEDLSQYYKRARFIVSPIFHGGGMKTKTAEALMYGKRIIGTQEAFEGYEIDPLCMHLANSPFEFINYIKKYEADKAYFHDESRKLFVSKYSYSSTIETFKEALQR